MKKNVTNAEIIDKAKKWIASYSSEELSKMIEDELIQLELDRMKFLEWFKDNKIKNITSDIGYKTKIKEDIREFVWTSSAKIIDDKSSEIDDKSSDISLISDPIIGEAIPRAA